MTAAGMSMKSDFTAKSPSMTCALALLVCVAFPLVSVRAAVLDVTAYGADPTGSRQSQAEIFKAVLAAKPGDVVFFPKGTYSLGKRIWVGEKKNITLRGESGTVIRMHCDPRRAEQDSSGAFYLYRCEDVAIERFTITTDNPIGCVGSVVSVDKDAKTIDFRIDAPFPASGEEHFFQLNTCDGEGMPDAALETHRNIERQTLPDGREIFVGHPYRMIGERLARITVPKWISLAAVTNGHRMLVRYFRNGEAPFVLNGVRRVRIEDVEIERTPSTGCVVVPPSEDLVFRRFSIRPRKDDPHVCASNSDGIHFVGCAGSVTLDDCHFKGLGDDALNIHSLGGEVKAFDAETGAFEFIRRLTDRRECALSEGWAAAGDRIAVYDPETLILRGEMALKSFGKEGRGIAAADGGVVPRIGDLVANARNYPEVRIMNCSVENTRARAFLLQTRKFTIENCRFRGLKSAAVLLACDMVFWNEMGPFDDAVVRNCTFEKCAKRLTADRMLGALTVRTRHDGGPAEYPAGVHRNLRIIGNTFEDIGPSAIYVEATDGLEILNNKFTRCAQNPDPTPEMRFPVRLRNCANATVEGNSFDGDPERVVSEEKLLPPKGTKDARRPYEMVWANRRADETTPVDRLESGEGWMVEGENVEAKVSSANDRLLFGDGTLRLDHRATGSGPKVRLRRKTPLALPPFDTFSVWIYGNNFYGRSPAGTPMTRLMADFADADGNPFTLNVATILHREWCRFQVKVPKDVRRRAMTGGCKFIGFTLTGGTNVDYRRIDLTSVCAFVEKLKPLSFRPRAKRGVQVFPDQPQGANVGEGRLPFPTVETTVVPPVASPDAALEFRTPKNPGIWDDLAFRIGKGPWIPLAIGGGVWPRASADNAKVRWKRIGDSLVADITVKGGNVEEVRFGGIGIDLDAKAMPIPFCTYGSEQWDERPQVVVADCGAATRFISATLDWTQSNASLPFPPTSVDYVQANGGARYRPKTDGTRNDVFERFVWTVSPRFEDALPFIPNPVSPWRPVTGRAAWMSSGASGDRTPNREALFWLRRKGVRRLIVTDHETGWRDGDESFTFRTDPAPGRGGDKGQYVYARKLIDDFGFRYGPYNNYTDYAPVNGNWRSDFVSRLEDGNWKLAWARCTAPKPLYSVEMCERLAPAIQRKFHFNTAYCDVHTAVSPWGRTDYDARVPGAGTFAQTFYAYGEIMGIQKRTWNGPVSSEGGHQWLYSGLTDHNYGQDRTYRLMEHPWIVDFNLLRMHPLTSDFGCYAGMLFGDANVPKGSPWRVVEPWTAVTLAFGHSAFILPQDQVYSYYMIVAPASRYSQENARKIRYADANGRLLTTSEAVVSGEIAHNRVIVAYDGGTFVAVNGDPDGGWLSVRRGKGRLALPQWGFFCRGGDTIAFSGQAKGGTNRVDFCRGGREAGYVFMHGRGTLTEFPGGATDGWLVRLTEDGGAEEVIPERKEGVSEIGLPYAATRLVGLRAASNAEEVREIPFRIDANGWTRFVRSPDCYSYRAILPKGFSEPSVDVYERWALKPNSFKATVQPRRVCTQKELPRRYRRGVLRPDGSEAELTASSGGHVQARDVICGGERKDGLAVHPPYKDGATGAAFVSYVLTPDASFRLFRADVGKADGTTPGDGILFKVAVKAGNSPLQVLSECRVAGHEWKELSADLSPYAGRRIHLYLLTDPGGNTYGDGGGWANLRLLPSVLAAK